MQPITIAPQGDRGRAFSAQLVAHMCADIWYGHALRPRKRPVWAVVAGSHEELRAFLANWRSGRVASGGSGVGDLELMKSAPYEVRLQRHPQGAIATVYLPDLVRADPGMVDPNLVRFAMLPPIAWARAQAIPDRAAIVEHVVRLRSSRRYKPSDEERADLDALVPHAYLFARYLDRRTRAPIPPDGRFYLQLLKALEDQNGLKRHVRGRISYDQTDGLHDAGIDSVGTITMSASHGAVEAVLAEEIARYFDATNGGTLGTD